MIRIKTLGSIFLVDEGQQRYARFPLHEGPREVPEWGDPDAGPLQDAVWHPYIQWTIKDDYLVFLNLCGQMIVAPCAELVPRKPQ